MNKHISEPKISHLSSNRENEDDTNYVPREKYFIESEKQLVRQQQFLKIMALSFHNFLIKSHRNIAQKNEPNNSECCNLRQELRQTILDHESKLAMYFGSDITKSLGLTPRDRNHPTGN